MTRLFFNTRTRIGLGCSCKDKAGPADWKQKKTRLYMLSISSFGRSSRLGPEDTYNHYNKVLILPVPATWKSS